LTAHPSKATKATLREWRATRAWNLLTSALAAVGWVIAFVGLLLSGEIASPDPSRQESVKSVRGAWRAHLALARTKGRARAVQVDVLNSFSVKWRGRGAMLRGFAWRDDVGITWSPDRRWKELGARDFAIEFATLDACEVAVLSGGSIGVVLRDSESEVWLLVHGEQDDLTKSLLTKPEPPMS